MTDLHTHILPGMDDGAADLKTAVRLLEMEYKQGVSRIALTSHYDCETTSLGDYLKRRQRSVNALMRELSGSENPVQCKLGAEVFFSPSLAKVNVQDLCLEGTGILLIELPMSECRPVFMNEMLDWLLAEGIVPLIAHIERYPYVMNDPSLIRDWIDMGAFTQVNAASLLRRGRSREAILGLIRNRLVHTVASDTHSVGRRPPQMAEAIGVIRKRLGDGTARKMISNAADLYNGLTPDVDIMEEPRGWRRFFRL